MATQNVRRSGLTMPIVTPRFVDNAWRRECDYINLDLEDSVPLHLKAQARGLVQASIHQVDKGGADVFVRINHDTMLADLEGAVWPGLKRINYPKAEYPEEIKKLDEIITRLERERGIRPGTIEIGANLETAVGVANCFEIAAASPRVVDFGGATGYDMSRDLGVEMFVGFDQFVYGKGEAELAARTLGKDVRAAPFVVNRSGSVSDADRARREAEACRRCGFRLGGGLHPAVVVSQNEGFAPSTEEVENATWVLAQYRELVNSSDTWIEIDGHIIDTYEAARAQDTLDWAALCTARNSDKAAAVERTKALEAAQASRGD